MPADVLYRMKVCIKVLRVGENTGVPHIHTGVYRNFGRCPNTQSNGSIVSGDHTMTVRQHLVLPEADRHYSERKLLIRLTPPPPYSVSEATEK